MLLTISLTVNDIYFTSVITVVITFPLTLLVKLRSLTNGKNRKYPQRNEVSFLPSKTRGHLRFYFSKDWN